MLREAGFNWQHSTMQPSFCVTNICWSPQYWAIPWPYPYSGLLGPTGLPQISTGVSWPWLGPPKGSSLIPALQAYGDGFKNSHHISWTDLDSINVNESNDGKSATYSLQLNLVNIFPPLSTGGWRNKYVDRVIWHCGICIICDDALWGHPAPWLMHAIHIDLRKSWPPYHSYLQQCLICGLLLHLPQRQIKHNPFVSFHALTLTWPLPATWLNQHTEHVYTSSSHRTKRNETSLQIKRIAKMLAQEVWSSLEHFDIFWLMPSHAQRLNSHHDSWASQCLTRLSKAWPMAVMDRTWTSILEKTGENRWKIQNYSNIA